MRLLLALLLSWNAVSVLGNHDERELAPSPRPAFPSCEMTPDANKKAIKLRWAAEIVMSALNDEASKLPLKKGLTQ